MCIEFVFKTGKKERKVFFRHLKAFLDCWHFISNIYETQVVQRTQPEVTQGVAGFEDFCFTLVDLRRRKTELSARPEKIKWLLE